MKISKLLTVALPLALVGCDHDDRSDSIYTSSQPPAHGALAPTPQARHIHPPRDPGKSSYQPDPQQLVTPHPAPAHRAEYTTPSSRNSPSSPETKRVAAVNPPPPPPAPPPPPRPISPDPEWHPTEGHLVRAGDLVMELKGGNGGNVPNYGAMLTHLQTRMNLSPQQAAKVLDELGIEKS